MELERKEFWRWPEYRWTAPDLDWRGGEIVTGGIDIGSVSTQSVIMVDGKLYAYSNMRTGSSSPDSAENALIWALDETGLLQKEIHYIVGTGYGRLNVPMADRTITEIACHAMGANFIYGPSVRTILDVGGQDCKIIRCDEKGRVGNFLMNDKCAAGTGRGIEAFAELLSIPIEDIGERSFQVDNEPEPVSSTCVVFAKAEATGKLHEGWSANEVIAAYCIAMARRITELINRLGVEREFAITGGQSKNIGVVRRIEKDIGVEALPWKEIDPQIAGALGAALFAKALVEKSRKRKS
ncbi:MAG: benzoyl-CoA reductase, bzd-type, subunit Q [Thermodesulfobacteriota bacterium]|nr:benzoyl-CoA reductase, bzd-type, subunit Q [Thermodesulfobacteriota bacterium]